MDRATSVLITLLVYNAVLITVGLWAKGRNREVQDFFLGGRQLGAWVAAISASASWVLQSCL